MPENDPIREIFESVFGTDEKIEKENTVYTCNGIDYDSDPEVSEIFLARALNTENSFSNSEVVLREYAALRSMYVQLLEAQFTMTENAPDEVQSFTAVKMTTINQLSALLRFIKNIDTFRD